MRQTLRGARQHLRDSGESVARGRRSDARQEVIRLEGSSDRTTTGSRGSRGQDASGVRAATVRAGAWPPRSDRWVTFRAPPRLCRRGLSRDECRSAMLAADDGPKQGADFGFDIRPRPQPSRRSVSQVADPAPRQEDEIRSAGAVRNVVRAPNSSVLPKVGARPIVQCPRPRRSQTFTISTKPRNTVTTDTPNATRRLTARRFVRPETTNRRLATLATAVNRIRPPTSHTPKAGFLPPSIGVAAAARPVTTK